MLQDLTGAVTAAVALGALTVTAASVSAAAPGGTSYDVEMESTPRVYADDTGGEGDSGMAGGSVQ